MIAGVTGTDFALRLAEHVQLSLGGLLLAMAIAIPLGVVAASRKSLRVGVLAISNVLMTIPSLAMLSFLLPVLGLGFLPAVVALTVYALLPMLQNTVTGLMQVDPVYRQVADALAMTRWQRLWRIELPLAAPLIMAGVRTSAVWTVGIATICAFIGAGGLGDFINRGLALSNSALLLIGAVPSALLAMSFDRWLAGVSLALTRRRGRRWRRALLAGSLAVALLGLFAPALVRGVSRAEASAAQPLVIGCKNWGEQLVLGELVAQLAQQRYGIPVERRFGFGSTDLVHAALASGAIDVYPEYRGTAENLCEQKSGRPRAEAEAWYAAEVGAAWMPSLGFENTYALAVRQETADAHRLNTISDLVRVAPQLSAAWNAEFVGREDGWLGLQKRYGLTFADTRTLDAMLVYEAVAHKQADVTVVFSTDGRLAEFGLHVLADDRHFFPNYACFPIVREAALLRYPALRELCVELADRITPAAMRRMNRLVDVDKQSPASVAEAFLRAEGLYPVRGDE